MGVIRLRHKRNERKSNESHLRLQKQYQRNHNTKRRQGNYNERGNLCGTIEPHLRRVAISGIKKPQGNRRIHNGNVGRIERQKRTPRCLTINRRGKPRHFMKGGNNGNFGNHNWLVATRRDIWVGFGRRRQQSVRELLNER